ncbi:hypothetical protein F5Y03DRAFT_388576 [Xylaria venustula]|nr:hypothetical protein F5Y03DRAFT_388576 [Xylaria venustula]
MSTDKIDNNLNPRYANDSQETLGVFWKCWKKHSICEKPQSEELQQPVSSKESLEDLVPPDESELHEGDEGFVQLTWLSTNISSEHHNDLQSLQSISPSSTTKPNLQVRVTQHYLDQDDDGFDNNDDISRHIKANRKRKQAEAILDSIIIPSESSLQEARDVKVQALSAKPGQAIL